MSAFDTINQETLNELDETFGRGGYTDDLRQNKLAYHNGHHGREVGNAALTLCRVLDLGSLEQHVAQAAGYAHDIVQKPGAGVHEAESAEYMTQKLEEAGLFPAELRHMASLAILGTEPVFDNGRLASQKAAAMHYPNKTTELVAKSVASGDLGDIYQPQGPYLARQLFREIHGMKEGDELPFDKIIGFQRNQVAMLENYEYPLPQAEQTLATHKSQVIRYSNNLLKQLESGAIDNWEDLIASDRELIRRHS